MDTWGLTSACTFNVFFSSAEYSTNKFDIALLANTPNQAETLLHSLERAAAGIGLHVNHTKLNICVTTKQVTFPH